MTARDCEHCGTFARRCQSDRDDGETYCEVTGKRIDWRVPVGDWWRVQPGAYLRGGAAFRTGEPYSASPYAGAHVDHRASWAAGYLEARRSTYANLRSLIAKATRHDATLAARLMEVIDQFDPSTRLERNP